MVQGQQESRNKAMLRDEFLVNMQKFTSSISRTIQQIEGGVRLQVPDLQLSPHMSGQKLRIKGLASGKGSMVMFSWKFQIYFTVHIKSLYLNIRQWTPYQNPQPQSMTTTLKDQKPVNTAYFMLKKKTQRKLFVFHRDHCISFN